ncbi:hypothetical protein [Specibacter sp. RAF43]|uniref:hypothetical protein n=1 Tax=Specibacter sp. RAF43 TaxID=3233057 RepID=UPI003F9A4588
MRIAALAASAAMVGAIGMGGCGQAGGQPSEPAPGASTSAPDTTTLLQLNETLKGRLGPAYADGWIQDFTLHVAVTTAAAEKIVAEAGAVPTLISVNAKQLEAGLRSVAAWQAGLPGDLAAAIHKVITNGRAGNITVFVSAEKMDAVKRAAAADAPAGKVPLVFKESSGPATPL